MARRPVRINWRGPQVVAAVRQSAADGLNEGALVLRNAMRNGMARKRGLVIKRKGRRNRYISSSPGDYPGWRTGNLGRSLAVHNATARTLHSAAGVSLSAGKKKATAKGAEVGVYALWLEFGTSKMAPRPWGYRSYAENRSRIRSTVIRVARRSLARLLRKRGGR